jgi:hypothetical protein|tara:strand:+ start:848 stop:1156 length:309 start_codon:yes stop_codon:yes gene_type:complete
MIDVQDVRSDSRERFYHSVTPKEFPGSIIKAYSFPENHIIASEELLTRLNMVVACSRQALKKLDVEFHRDDNVVHLEGWAEANQLRYALEHLDEILEQVIYD